ncbi:MAG: AMP-binding protein, partial [Pseudomonadota bacterium]
MLEGIRTLADLIDRAAEEWPQKEAIVFKGQRIPYEVVQSMVNKAAIGFLRLGLKKGDKIAIWLSNIPEFVYTEFAMFKIGATMVPLNTRFKTSEMEYILKQSESSTLVMLDNFLGLDFIGMIREVCPELFHCKPGGLKSERLPLLRNVICVSKERYDGMFTYDEIMGGETTPQLEEELKRAQGSVEPDDIANIPYTSGTTGFPKGVMTSHHQYVVEVQTVGERIGIKEGDRINGGPPFCFNFGNITGPLMCPMFGATLIPLEFWDPKEALRLIQDEKCTHFTGAPTMYTMIMGRPDFDQFDLSSLRTGMIAAAPAPVELIRKSYEKMGFENLTAGYGMTENSGATSVSLYGDSPEMVSTTVGKPLPGVEVKVVDPNTGKDLPPGEQGELCTRGFLIMKGYY